MTYLKKFAAPVLVAAFSLSLAACYEREGALEEAGEEIDEAVDDAAD